MHSPAQRLHSADETRKSSQRRPLCQGGCVNSCCDSPGQHRLISLCDRAEWWNVSRQVVCVFYCFKLCNFFRTMGLVQQLKSQFLCHLFFSYVFLVSGLIINVLQICTLPVWLFNKQLARRINIRLGYCISSRKYKYCSYSLGRWWWCWSLLSAGAVMFLGMHRYWYWPDTDLNSWIRCLWQWADLFNSMQLYCFMQEF